MKNKIICICIVFIMAVTSLTACSSKKSSYEAATDGTQSSVGQQSRGNWQGRGNRKNGAQSGVTSQSAGDSTQNGGVPQQGGTSGGMSSSQTQILGTVTSIIGNEVELAVGTQSNDQSSSKLTATGETKTLLIPVGLSLSSSFGSTGTAGTFAAGGNTAVSGNAMPGGNAAGGTGTAATGTSRTGTGTGTTARSAGNATARSTTGTATKTSGTATTTKRTSDFSTITKGMVLRITQKTINGNLTIVRVAIVSK
jgi:hypothetical protein